MFLIYPPELGGMGCFMIKGMGFMLCTEGSVSGFTIRLNWRFLRGKLELHESSLSTWNYTIERYDEEV